MMETWAPARDFVEHPAYAADRTAALAALKVGEIDAPIRGLVRGFSRIPHCFTLQSCYGHFCVDEEQDRHNLAPLPAHDVGPVLYRIAYVALCIENSAAGRAFRRALEGVAAADPEYVQFGSPVWFWERQVNSYSLQIEPARIVDRDSGVIGHEEALRVVAARDRIFRELRVLLGDAAG